MVDVSGTTSDVGVLANGFPREATTEIDVAGIRTNFRMPDVLSIGIGGGSLVASEAGSAIFQGLPKAITVWESHCDEVKDLPADFVRMATNGVSAIQAMQHTSRPLFGVQFHPELFDEEHPHGRTVLENFLNL